MGERPAWRDAQAARDAAERERWWGMQLADDPRGSAAPADLARAAYKRGDRLFQIDLPTSVIQGWAHDGHTASRIWRPEDDDVLGSIEAAGWQLEHFNSTFVTHGSTATQRVISNVASTVTAYHGAMVGTDVFRRKR